jgi:hypothetical protein
VLITAALATLPAEASILHKEAKFASDDAGYSTVRVCLVEGSTSLQQSQSCPGCAHATNPGLTELVEHIRQALSQSWEAHSGVRFIGFDWCGTLGDASGYVGLFIHPRADNVAYIGTGSQNRFDRGDPGVSFKPWGNGSACIRFDWSHLRMGYSFECVEQYAIHELGHVLGFVHEWRHPNTPAGCEIERSISTEPDGGVGFAVSSQTYDWDSIMTYTDACAHVTGVRFGSPNLSPTDIAGLEAAYPRGVGPYAASATPLLGERHPARGWGAKLLVPLAVFVLAAALARRVSARRRAG